jgi:hypothetical protein
MKTIRFFTNVAFLLAALTTWAGASTTCDTLLKSGTVVNPMIVCISNHGNLVGFASPARFDGMELFVPIEHIRVGVIGEGYALCDLNSTTRSFDAGFDEAAWGESTVSQPNGPNTLPLTITRTTLDGRFRLIQSFSRDTSRKEILIGMSVKNLSSTTAHVVLARYADFDIDGTSGTDIFSRSNSSVFALEQNAMSLTSTVSPFTGVSVFTAVEKKSDWSPLVGTGTHTGCSPIPQTTPTAGQIGAPGPGDYVARLTFGFFLSSGQSRGVVVAYRRQ